MQKIEADVIIVGSGAGGATVAKELAGTGRNIAVLEKGSEAGRYRHYRKLRSVLPLVHHSFREFNGKKLRGMKISTVSLIGIGGTTVVSSANFVRSLERELQSLGIPVQNEFEEIERELKVTLFPMNRLGKGAQKLWEAADTLSFKWEMMPRAVDFSKCRSCGFCTIKCPSDSKWTAVRYLDEARKKGVRLENVAVDEILSSNGRVSGVRGKIGSQKIEVFTDIVVLAAGAIETAIILKNSGIDRAGEKLFCDPYYVIHDSSNGDFFCKEPRALINKEFVRDGGFMLANCNVTRYERVYEHLPNFLKPEKMPGMLGVMVKIKDDSAGVVHRNGTVEKSLTPSDVEKIKASIPIARDILLKAGVDSRHIKIKFFPGVHPGGTAAIGEVVDRNLQTEIENCYVSDASVLPEAPGLPPLLTIMALAKRLAKRLSSN